MKAILIKQEFFDYCGIVMAEMPQLEVVEIEPKLDTYYKMLDCDTVEMPSRKIGGKYFIKPEFVAISRDFVSRRFSDKLSITFPFCGKCRKSLFKQYKIAEEALVVISSKRGNILNIEPYKS